MDKKNKKWQETVNSLSSYTWHVSQLMNRPRDRSIVWLGDWPPAVPVLLAEVSFYPRTENTVDQVRIIGK